MPFAPVLVPDLTSGGENGKIPKTMDTLDRQLLNIIQAEFPLDPRPYQVIGERLGIPEAEALARVKSLAESGIIRRIGPSFDSRRLGYVSTLVAMKAPPDRLEDIAGLISSYPEVTHNYGREDEFNLWFALVARDWAQVERIVSDIKARTGVGDIHVLPAERLFKIRVEFDFTGEPAVGDSSATDQTRSGRASVPASGAEEPTSDVERPAQRHGHYDEVRRRIITALVGGLPLTSEPFRDVAEDVGIPVDDLLAQLAAWKSDGTIRRFGAILRHREAGYSVNAMGAWNVPDDRVEWFGRTAAELRSVSHCYERPRFEGFPYNVYTMIHGHSRDECEETARSISDSTGITDFRLLYTTAEFKKTAPSL